MSQLPVNPTLPAFAAGDTISQGRDIPAPVGTNFHLDTTLDRSSGQVFATWEELLSALAQSPLVPKHVWILASTTLPAGDWDLSNSTLHGNGAFGSPIIVTIPGTASLTGFHRVGIEGGIILSYTGAAADGPCVLVDSAPYQFYAKNDASVRVTSTGDFFEVTSTEADLVLFTLRYGGGFLDGGGSGACLNYTGAGSTVVVALPAGNGQCAAGTLAGGVGLVLLTSAANNPGSGARPIDPTTTGAAFVLRATDAFSLGYVATTTANWAGDDPVSVGEALDRLAAQVDALGAAP